ncbi:hypothetical protein AB6A40_010325 [Gnathostoma spinigerum]|uniref:NADH dehydrogenase subunit 2 n=1 Tax=Gnathostoma spinigerum TaxID=75299 RepID=A0ABD6EUS3_9BILA
MAYSLSKFSRDSNIFGTESLPSLFNTYSISFTSAGSMAKKSRSSNSHYHFSCSTLILTSSLITFGISIPDMATIEFWLILLPGFRCAIEHCNIYGRQMFVTATVFV